jgi:photosystem II stability/assembly factor-like uncharacterized protein
VQWLLMLLLAFVPADQPSMWSVKTSGMRTNLRGVSVVMARDDLGASAPVIWACGSNGVILKSRDNGSTWNQYSVAGGEKLDFRGIQAFDGQMAYVISIGNGENSRVYKTADGGIHWSLQYTDQRKEFFLDDIVCISRKKCLVAGDPIGGKLFLAATSDGEHWKERSRDNMPPALPGEGAFAASSSTFAIYNERDIYVGTGGPAARVFHSPDLGKTWSVASTPILSGEASQGIFSIIREGNTLVAVGGDYKDLTRADKAAAYSAEGGAWELATQQPGGFRSGVAYLGGTTFVAVGPSGEDISSDLGVHWRPFGSLNLNAVTALGTDVWGVGPKGTIATISISDLRPLGQE